MFLPERSARQTRCISSGHQPARTRAVTNRTQSRNEHCPFLKSLRTRTENPRLTPRCAPRTRGDDARPGPGDRTPGRCFEKRRRLYYATCVFNQEWCRSSVLPTVLAAI
jgi:hypothetical protein